MQCFKLDTGAKYGTCTPSICNYENDCPSWMSCNQNKCVYDPCSHENPCKPGLTCVRGFLPVERQTIKTYFCKKVKKNLKSFLIQ